MFLFFGDDHGARRQTVGARGAHEIRSQHRKHGGARHATKRSTPSIRQRAIPIGVCRDVRRSQDCGDDEGADDQLRQSDCTLNFAYSRALAEMRANGMIGQILEQFGLPVNNVYLPGVS